MTSAAVCAEGFCKEGKKDLQLCAQEPAAVCAADKRFKGSTAECVDQLWF